MGADEQPESDDEQREQPTEVTAWERPIGRYAFFGTVAAGIGALVAFSRSTAINEAVTAVNESIKPGGGWRIYAVESPMPIFEPDTFKLKIGGEVENPIELTWDEIQEWATAKNTSDFHCVTGWSVYDVDWDGILASEIVDRVRPTSKAKYVTMRSLETSYADQVTMEQFMYSKNILAHSLDGKPLPREQGSPLRMVLPEMYGYKGVKWVNELSFDAEMELGYWEQRGYDVDAYVGNSNDISA